MFARTVGEAIADRSLEPAYRAELLRLPTVAEIMLEVGTEVDPALAAKARTKLTRRVATLLAVDLIQILDTERASEPYSPDAGSVGRRALRNVVLSILSSRGTAKDMARLYEHYVTATNMTDQAHALTTLAQYDTPYRAKALAHFYERWHTDDVVIDTWFHAQAQSSLPSTLDVVQALTAHPQFALTSPNKVRALLGTFAANPVQFHHPDGAGYEFIADQVLAIDRFNPQVAARLLSSFKTWRSLEPGRRDKARMALMRVARHPLLSRDVHEIVTKMWER
jgi:aminopeptidase N